MKNRRQLMIGTGIFAVASAFGLSRFSKRSQADTVDGSQHNKTFEIMKTPEEWKKILTPEQYRVLRKHGTEYAFSSPLDKQYGAGTYKCAGCDLPLFQSTTKYDSGTGWPSFYAPIDNAVETSVDTKLFVQRTEVHCRRCGGHLGHVFPDGPQPTGQRYCMNGVAMKFEEDKDAKKETDG